MSRLKIKGQIHAMRFAPRKTYTSASDKLEFGLHKGQTVEHVFDIDKAWLIWAVKEANVILPEDIMKRLFNTANEARNPHTAEREAPQGA